MSTGRFKRCTVVVVCLAAMLLIVAGAVAFATEHAVTVAGKPYVKASPRPAPTGMEIVTSDYCPIDEDGEAYICERIDYQTWWKFDLSGIPAGSAIQAIQFTAFIYSSSPPAQRTLWYDADDSWDGETSCPGGKELPELVGTIIDENSDYAWQTFDVDMTGHDWSDDLADGAITLMLTGPLNYEHDCGNVALPSSGNGPSITITYDAAVPTTGVWGAVALSLALIGAAGFAIRRRRVQI
jgi:hypothetical protein